MNNLSNKIRKCLKSLVISLCGLAMIASCGTQKQIVTEHRIEYSIRDSVNYIDSIVYHHLYKEVYRDYTGLLDTLNLETSYASAKAYVDTTNNTLKGEIKNKDKDIPVPIKWKEKIVYRDSLVYKEVPVKVEVPVKYIPKYVKGLAIVGLISILLFIFAIIKKFAI